MNDIDNMNKNCGAAEAFEELTFEQAASKLEEILEGDTNTLNSIIYVLCISIICRTNRRYGNDSFAYFSNIIAFNSNWQHFKSESKVLVSNNHSNYICAICVYIL